jgi:hypothetical protein
MKEGTSHNQQERRAAATDKPAPVSKAVSFPAPIQMYTTAGGKKISATGNFYVKTGAPEKLFVKNGIVLDSRGAQIIADGSNENHAGSAYDGYHYYVDDTGGFVNDCLGLSEKLALSDPADTGRAEFRAPGSGPGEGKVFGNTYVQNTEIATNNAWYTDEATDPAVGEAYAIVPTVKPGNDAYGNAEAPYHAATVIAKDGTDNITLEADAGMALSRPIFDIYDTQPPGTRIDGNSKTFHEVYSLNFTYARKVPQPKAKKRKRAVVRDFAPSTGVLRPRTD